MRSDAGLGPVGARCADRQTGLDCKAYLHQSLTAPAEYLVEGYAAIMPDASRILSSDQVWALVAFLQSQGGEVTVSGDDIQSVEGGGGADPPPPAGPQLAGTSDPVELMNELGCLVCHQLGDQGNAIGPALTDVGARRNAAYIRESILQPAADTSPGYEAFAGTMPPNFGDRMTAAQLEALVAYLAGRQGN